MERTLNHLTPSLDAARHDERRFAETDNRQAAERDLAEQFMAAAKRGDMAAWAQFAGLTTDWKVRTATGDKNAKRPQLVGEVLADSLQYDAPSISEVMGLLCAVSRGDDQTTMAQMLLTRMARTWAAQNAGEAE
jgi:hypothetical protein